MKNTLFYYYHLTPEKIIKKDNYYYFYLDNYIYYLYKVNRPLEYIDELIMLTRVLTYSNFMMIIFNINREVLSIINGHYYILLRIVKNNKFNIIFKSSKTVISTLHPVKNNVGIIVIIE